MSRSRNVTQVDTPAMLPGGTSRHRNRLLVAPGQWKRTDPFLGLMEDWYTRGAFENHPHRGIETFTYMIHGSNVHYDNRGNEGIIGPGEALWMTAGRGIVHNEIPIDDRPVHTLQLWINLPRAAKLVEADVQELKGERAPRRHLPGTEVIVFSGSSADVVAPTRNYAEVTLIEVRLQPASTFEQHLPADYNGFAFVLGGSGYIGANATPVHTGQIAWLQHEEHESSVRFEAKDGYLRILLFAGNPLREAVVTGGPFVMNTKEEIEEAYAEYHQTREKFGLAPLTD